MTNQTTNQKTNQNLIKSILFSMALFLAVTMCSADETPVRFASPRADDMWVGTVTVRLDFSKIDIQTVSSVEYYLDGKQLKIADEAPFSFQYDFGDSPKYHKLAALVRVHRKVKYKAELHSYKTEDYKEVDVVQMSVPVTVIDKKGFYVMDLKKEDFLLEVDGVEQPVSFLEKEGSSNSNLLLFIDISTSMKNKLGTVRAAAKIFLKQVMNPSDRAKVVLFNHDIAKETAFTKDINHLFDSISSALPSGATALYDAVAYASKVASDLSRRSIIVLFSDGEDNKSALDPFTLIKQVEKSNAVIYSIGQKTGADPYYEDILQKISASSGGMVFFTRDLKNLRKIYDKIRKDIRSQYVLYFSPRNMKKQNRFRKITVKLTNGKKYKLRVPKGCSY